MIYATPSKIDNIYLDYQASTPMAPEVLDAFVECCREHYGNPHALEHASGWDANNILEENLRTIADAARCDPDEIIVTSGATEANNLAILGFAEAAPAKRKRILVSEIEHKSVLEAAELASQRYGCDVEYIPVDRNGVVRLEALERMMESDVLLICVMWVNNEVGSIQPIKSIAALADGAGALLHCDATHTLNCERLSFYGIGAHSVSLSAHKIYGPKGVGALLVRRDVQSRLAPQMVGGHQQAGLRAGTVPVPLCAALAASVALASDRNADLERQRIAEMRNNFAERLLRVQGVAINGPVLTNRHPGNLNLQFDGCDARDVLAYLQPRLAASSGSACTAGTLEPSYVLRAMGLSEAEAASSIRFGFGRFLTIEQVEQAANLVAEAFQSIRVLHDSGRAIDDCNTCAWCN